MPDKLKILPQELRENADPEEAIRPMPWLAAVVAIGMVIFGIVYLLMNPAIERTDLGDMRTVADLRPTAQAAAPGAAVDGGAIFAANCAACHQASGKGAGPIKPLDGSAIVKDADHAKQIQVLLQGAANGAMPAWKQLSDTDLAAVVSYTKNAWSNKTGQLVQPSEIVAQRAK